MTILLLSRSGTVIHPLNDRKLVIHGLKLLLSTPFFLPMTARDKLCRRCDYSTPRAKLSAHPSVQQYHPFTLPSALTLFPAVCLTKRILNAHERAEKVLFGWSVTRIRRKRTRAKIEAAGKEGKRSPRGRPVRLH